MRRFQPSPAMVVALLALVFAMAGTGLAAKTYVVSSTKQIKNGAVTGADVKNSSLRGSDVKNSSLTGADIKNKSLTAADFNGSIQGPQGSVGAQGPKGDTGTKGDPGSVGVNGATAGLERHLDAPGQLNAGGGEQQVITLNSVPAGSYVLTAKLWLSSVAASPTTPDCYLRAGADFDHSRATVVGLAATALSFVLTHTFTSTGTATLSCDPKSETVFHADAKISAIQVQTLIRNAP